MFFKWGRRLRLPELVESAVLHDLVPERDVVLEIAHVDVGERPQLEEKRVAVGRAGIEALRAFLGRLGTRVPERREEVEGVRELKGAVVVPVVAGEPVGDRRLGRRGLEGGVGVDHAGGRVKPGIRNAPHPDPAVMIWHMF